MTPRERAELMLDHARRLTAHANGFEHGATIRPEVNENKARALAEAADAWDVAADALEEANLPSWEAQWPDQGHCMALALRRRSRQLEALAREQRGPTSRDPRSRRDRPSKKDAPRYADLRERARQMRASGATVREIENALGVSRSTASLWARGVTLSPAMRAKLEARQRRRPEEGPPEPPRSRARCTGCGETDEGVFYTARRRLPGGGYAVRRQSRCKLCHQEAVFQRELREVMGRDRSRSRRRR